MGNTARGKYAKFISDRSGLQFPYSEMVREWNGARVHISEFEPKQDKSHLQQISCQRILFQLMAQQQ